MYIITAEHRHNRDMGFVCLPSLSLSYLDINTCTGTQCSPPPTPSSFHYLSRTHPRYNYNPLNPRYSPRERILLRPLQRPLNPEHHWLMPHFSFWAWPLPFIGTLDSALSRISFVEASTPWSKKIDKVVWRGTAWFNSVGNTNLRPKLLEVTKGKEWADVEDLKWYNIHMHVFCREMGCLSLETPRASAGSKISEQSLCLLRTLLVYALVELL